MPIKIGKKRHKNKMMEVQKAQDTEKYVDLLAQGYTYREIGEMCGVSRSTVYRYINDALDKHEAFTDRELTQWRTQQLVQLEGPIALAIRDASVVEVQDEMGEWIVSPTEAAKIRNMGATRLVKLMERQSKLLGLDQPVRTEVDVDATVRVAVIQASMDAL